MSIADQAAAQLPYVVEITSPLGKQADELELDMFVWCHQNCVDKFDKPSKTSTWRGGPAWKYHVRFASERDASLFKLFHDGAV